MISARREESLPAFLTALASAAPAPGGGAATALCGALAAALLAMVGRVTVGHDPSETGEMGPLVARADQLAQRLAELVTEDMHAYEGVMAARRSGEGGDAMQRALARATETPLMMARSSRDVLVLCEAVAARARPRTISDLGVAATLAWGALEAAALTARANLADVTDARFARVAQGELADLLAQGRAAHERLSDTIAGRANRPD